MDEWIYFGSAKVCEVLRSVGLSQLAFEMGFKGQDLWGRPGVYCGPQAGVYFWGIGVWMAAIYFFGILAASIFRKNSRQTASEGEAAAATGDNSSKDGSR